MQDGNPLPPELVTWIERFAADVSEVVQWFQRLHDAGQPLDTSDDFPTHGQHKLY